jgi:hypothetical protein
MNDQVRDGSGFYEGPDRRAQDPILHQILAEIKDVKEDTSRLTKVVLGNGNPRDGLAFKHEQLKDQVGYLMEARKAHKKMIAGIATSIIATVILGILGLVFG